MVRGSCGPDLVHLIEVDRDPLRRFGHDAIGDRVIAGRLGPRAGELRDDLIAPRQRGYRAVALPRDDAVNALLSAVTVGLRPGEAVRALQQRAVLLHGLGLDPEAVKADPHSRQDLDELADLAARLATADGAEADDWLGREVDPGGPVLLDALDVLLDRLALKDRDDMHAAGDQLTEPDHARDRQVLVLGDRLPGLREHDVLTHPVLRGGPAEPADLVGVADQGLGVLLWRDRPAAMLGQLREAARVAHPVGYRGPKRLVPTEPAVRNHQLDLGVLDGREPCRLRPPKEGRVDPEVELHTSDTRPTALGMSTNAVGQPRLTSGPRSGIIS